MPKAKAAVPATTAVAKVDPKKAALTQFDSSILLGDAKRDRGVKRDDLAIEFLRVLQGLSPQVTRGHAKYIKDAKVGQFFTTVSGDLFDGDEGVDIVPIFHVQSYIRWTIREKGAGMVQDFGQTKPDIKTAKDEKKRDRVLNPDGSMTNDNIAFSHQFFVFLYDKVTGEFKPVAFNLAGKQIKKARAWMTFMESVKADSPKGDGSKFNPAWWYYTYNIRTVPESNESGSWMGLDIPNQFDSGRIMETLTLPFGSGVYLAARDYADLVAGGKVKTQKPDEETVEAEITPAGEGDGDEGF